jgi:hypothetical protein
MSQNVTLVLRIHSLVTRGRRRNHFKAEGTGLSRPDHPNDLWCVDYKGEFMLADRRYPSFVTTLDQSTEISREEIAVIPKPLPVEKSLSERVISGLSARICRWSRIGPRA